MSTNGYNCFDSVILIVKLGENRKAQIKNKSCTLRSGINKSLFCSDFLINSGYSGFPADTCCSFRTVDLYFSSDYAEQWICAWPVVQI